MNEWIYEREREKKVSNKTNWKKKPVSKVFFPLLFILYFWSLENGIQCIWRQQLLVAKKKSTHTSLHTAKWYEQNISWLVSVCVWCIVFSEDKVLCAQIWTILTLFKFGLFHFLLDIYGVLCGAVTLKTIST